MVLDLKNEILKTFLTKQNLILASQIYDYSPNLINFYLYV